MFAIFSLLVALVLSMAVVRVASVALSLTGLSRELARFQARSAFTGSGFTTAESEKVVRHPVRRKIIMLLMILGNAGIVTVMSSLVLSVVTVNAEESVGSAIGMRLLLLLGGLTLLWTVANSQWVDRQLSWLVTWALKRWTNVVLRDYAGLLHLSKGYGVSELQVQPDDWLANHTLMELRLSEEGVLVLGVEKADGTYFGAPRGGTEVEAGDSLYLYGSTDQITKLDQRRAGTEGNWDHHKAVDQQKKVEADEAELQAERTTHHPH